MVAVTFLSVVLFHLWGLTMGRENIFLAALFFIAPVLGSCGGGVENKPVSAQNRWDLADGTVSVYSFVDYSGDTSGSVNPGNARKWVFLAGGCFWGTEKYLALIPGVIKTEVGYANGRTAFPSYEDVCYRNTGHAETVLVEYDSTRLELSNLLDLFYSVIDPTSLNRQGNDVGTQYRTGIYYIEEADRKTIDASISRLSERTPRPVVVEVTPLQNYYAAEEYHQKYLEKNPGGYCHISNDKFEEVSGLKW